MQRALLVVDDGIDPSFITSAGELTGGVGAELLIISVVDSGELRSSAERTAVTGEGAGSVEEVKRQAADDAAKRVSEPLAEIDVTYRTEGVVGKPTEAILEYAADHDCDHVFVSGPGRTPAGKALFGDTIQTVILEFDGLVTVNVG